MRSWRRCIVAKGHKYTSPAVKPSHKLVIGFVLVLAGCSTTGEGGVYDFDCPTSPLVQLSVIDVSESGRDEKLIGERLDAVQAIAEFVTDCEGTFIVRAGSSSVANSELLFSGRLGTKGSTEIGRDRKIPAAVEEVMTEIRATLNAALAATTPQGNDLTALLAMVSDFASQFDGEDADLRATLYTDAISTTGLASINQPNLDRTTIQQIVADQRLPRLDNVNVSIRGVGRVGGSLQPPQDYVDLVNDYARSMCNATGASCTVLTSTNAVR